LKEFGGHVGWCADHEPAVSVVFFRCGAKIDEREVGVSADEDVFWLDIAVDDLVLLEEGEGGDDVGKVECGGGGVEGGVGLDEGAKTAVGDELEGEIEVAPVVEGVDYAGDEGVPGEL